LFQSFFSSFVFPLFEPSTFSSCLKSEYVVSWKVLH
jgi:hypothetical protein